MGDLIKEIKIDKNVLIPAWPIPAPLFDFIATGISATEIELIFGDPGEYATSYVIEWGQSPAVTGEGTLTIPSNPMGAILEVINGLLNSTAYKFRVKAVNSSGSSAWVTADASTL